MSSSFYSVAYVLICEQDENRALASYNLGLLLRTIDDHFKKSGICAFPKEV